jgi:hypothetical protein
MPANRLPARGEKSLQQLRAFRAQNSFVDDQAVVQQVRIGELELAARAAEAQIASAKNKAREAGGDRSAGAHDAGFDGGVERRVLQTIVPDGCSSLPNRQDLGMRRGIVALNGGVPAAADDSIFQNDDGSHGNFPGVIRLPRKIERHRHKSPVIHSFPRIAPTAGHVNNASCAVAGQNSGWG